MSKGTFVQIPKFTIGRQGHFVTDSEAIYDSEKFGRIVVPPNFETDFASIPNWVPRWLFDPMRHARYSAVFHDYLCRTAESYKERVMADHVFLEAMGVEGVKRWRRASMFSAVRANTYRMRLMRKWK
jgi:hypothetical protein